MFSLYTPTKVIRDSNDPFFEEGNIAIRAYWLERDARSEQDIAIIREEASMLTDDLQRPIYCEHASCVSDHGGSIPFPSITAYEEHYEARHTHVCFPCDKTFPNATFLQLHLDEYHDAFLKIRKERGEKIYQCFVESCNKKCSTTKRRMQHLTQKHRYPSDFPFDIVATGTLSFEERQARIKRQRAKKLRAQQTNTLSSTTTASSSHEANSSQQCQPSKKESYDDMDVDQLTYSMAALSIPKTISFGRGKPAFARRSQQHHQHSYGGSGRKQQEQQQDMMEEEDTQRNHNKVSGERKHDQASISRRRRRRRKNKGVNDMMDQDASQ